MKEPIPFVRVDFKCHFQVRKNNLCCAFFQVPQALPAQYNISHILTVQQCYNHCFAMQTLSLTLRLQLFSQCTQPARNFAWQLFDIYIVYFQAFSNKTEAYTISHDAESYRIEGLSLGSNYLWTISFLS